MLLPEAPSSRSVLVLGRPGDAVAREIAGLLDDRFEVRTEDVEYDHDALLETIEGQADNLGALVVAASSSTAATTLLLDLVSRAAALVDRTLVVVRERAQLDALPARLREKLRCLVLGEGDLEALVMEIVHRAREIDVLATLVRAAIARRDIDLLTPDAWAVDRLELARLQIAHVGDGGRRANPLWARWIAESATTRLADLRHGLSAFAASEDAARGAPAFARGKSKSTSKSTSTSTSMSSLKSKLGKK